MTEMNSDELEINADYGALKCLIQNRISLIKVFLVAVYLLFVGQCRLTKLSRTHSEATPLTWQPKGIKFALHWLALSTGLLDHGISGDDASQSLRISSQENTNIAKIANINVHTKRWAGPPGFFFIALPTIPRPQTKATMMDKVIRIGA
jgi:hypothetical protein